MNPQIIASLIQAATSIGGLYMSQNAARQDYNTMRRDRLSDRAFEMNYNDPSMQVSRLRAAGLPARDVVDTPISTGEMPTLDTSSAIDKFAPSIGDALSGAITRPLDYKAQIESIEAQRLENQKLREEITKLIDTNTVDEATRASRIAEILVSSDAATKNFELLSLRYQDQMTRNNISKEELSRLRLENEIIDNTKSLKQRLLEEEILSKETSRRISQFELENLAPERLKRMKLDYELAVNGELRNKESHRAAIGHMSALTRLALLNGDVETLKIENQKSLNGLSDLELKRAQDTYEESVKALKAKYNLSEKEARFYASRQIVGMTTQVINSAANFIGAVKGFGGTPASVQNAGERKGLYVPETYFGDVKYDPFKL